MLIKLIFFLFCFEKDPLIFVKRHAKIGTVDCLTCIRLNHYPPTANFDVKEGQVRCGEHSDYGSITFLFQKDQGGLEVLYIPEIPEIS